MGFAPIWLTILGGAGFLGGANPQVTPMWVQNSTTSDSYTRAISVAGKLCAANQMILLMMRGCKWMDIFQLR
jgi:hypothetical protein